MNYSKSLIAITMSIFVASTAWADNTDDEGVSVAGTIIAALELEVVTPLRFGELAANASGDPVDNPFVEVSVTDTATGDFSVSYTDNGSPDAGEPGTGTETIAAGGNRSALGPAELTVSGEPDFNYIASVPGIGNVVAVEGNGVNFTVVTPTGAQQLDGTGADTLYIGGRMNIVAATPPGGYTSNIDVTVTYD